jgi:hypothetical protein
MVMDAIWHLIWWRPQQQKNGQAAQENEHLIIKLAFVMIRFNRFALKLRQYFAYNTRSSLSSTRKYQGPGKQSRKSIHLLCKFGLD